MKHPAVAILEDLIRIPSVNPHYGEGAQGEMELSRYIERYCRDAGLAVSRQPVYDGRDNLIIELRTGHPESVLLFEAHMDTVSFGGMPDPLEPRCVDGRMYGRGACDTKGSLAAMMYAMAECAKRPEKLRSDLVLCAAVDEEHACGGILKFLELDLPVSAAIVGEPTDLHIVVAHKGCVRFAVTTHGKAAHSSVPHEGENAIVAMADVVSHLAREVTPRLKNIADPLCGPATLSIGTIHGGEQINIVPDRCTIRVDRRIVPGETPEGVWEQIRTELSAWCTSRGIRCTVEPLLLDWALDTPADDPVVQTARDAAVRLGLSPEPRGETYGSDASKLRGRKGIPSIVFGPGSIAQAHSADEWVAVADVERAAAFYMELAQSYRKP